MWFEEWTFHADFGGCASEGATPEGVRVARRIRSLQQRRGLVERGLLAALDLELHRRQEGRVDEIYAELADRYGVREWVALADLVPYFTAPMQQSNPGAEFSTLWGWAAASELFQPYREHGVKTVRDAWARFAACFDPDRASTRPVAASAMGFLRW